MSKKRKASFEDLFMAQFLPKTRDDKIVDKGFKLKNAELKEKRKMGAIKRKKLIDSYMVELKNAGASQKSLDSWQKLSDSEQL
jgi:hypothetical protein